jgi:glycosyltransferase involved in cell wall biosynthesis
VTTPKLAILVSFSGQGGVERMISQLATAFVELGIEVDLLLVKAKGPFCAALPPEARQIPLRTRHTATSVWEVARYLRRERPTALLAVKHRAIIAALRARSLSGVQVPIAGRLGTTVSAALAAKSVWRRTLWYRAMKQYYPQLDGIIPVSEGVAADIHQITGLPWERLTVIRNPVITSSLMDAAGQPVDHPWLQNPEYPVIMGAGRLTEQKDFPTLISAFAAVRRVRPARLIILGDGQDRDALLALAQQQGVLDDIALPGFQLNPYAWLSKANVYVLSSRWEGSPNSLTEAMALGTPVVATDCPSGPRELLDGGRIAPLVAMGDVPALADAIIKQLDAPTPGVILQDAVKAYHAHTSAKHYLHTLGMPCPQG